MTFVDVLIHRVQITFADAVEAIEAINIHTTIRKDHYSHAHGP